MSTVPSQCLARHGLRIEALADSQVKSPLSLLTQSPRLVVPYLQPLGLNPAVEQTLISL